MISEHPLLGVGPGRVDALYTRYLSPGEPVPAYHGHLHNDAIHLAAQFGIPVLCAALLFLAILLRDLLRAFHRASDRETRFVCSAGLLGLTAFLLAGLTDYAYGHSLGLILFSFVALSPLAPAVSIRANTARLKLPIVNLDCATVPAAFDTEASLSRPLLGEFDREAGFMRRGGRQQQAEPGSC